jgi:predicted AAA+ superfamily ATPase
MYVPRLLSETLQDAVKHFPAVLVTGPRQAGKTTFLLHQWGEKSNYVSFDDPLERGFAVSDPNGFLDRFEKRHVILDEIQYVPDILSYLKIRIDKNRTHTGKWLLTGSQQFHLMKNVSESLAGRIAILELLPFSVSEHRQGGADWLESTIWFGGYPEPSLFHERRDLWIRSYIQTYIERDVRQLQNIKDIRAFEQFVGLSASIHGQTLNTATLSRQCGVSLPTVRAWIGILETSFLCLLLPPYYKNFGKRLIKASKLYFIDPALVCALTRQPDGRSSLSGAMGGALFEGLIVSEAFKVFSMKGRRADLFFWRSHDGMEVDLILLANGKLHPVEIKLTATPTLKHVEPLNKFKQLAGREASDTGVLVCRVDKKTDLPSHNIAIPWHSFPEWLSSMLEGLRPRL